MQQEGTPAVARRAGRKVEAWLADRVQQDNGRELRAWLGCRRLIDRLPRELAVVVEVVVEAEIRSAEGTPREGLVELELEYGEAVFALAAVVGSEAETATEAEIYASLRGKLLAALGMAPS